MKIIIFYSDMIPLCVKIWLSMETSGELSHQPISIEASMFLVQENKGFRSTYLFSVSKKLNINGHVLVESLNTLSFPTDIDSTLKRGVLSKVSLCSVYVF